MDRVVQKISPTIPLVPTFKRVAAYARVSSGKDAMLHSLSAQVSSYSRLIQNHNGWLYCGVYADEALTGTKETRPQFQRMLEDCKKGKIDLIITKSISRFARNTVTLLQTIRELKLLNVGVYFEEQNINTLDADGELILTILASYAQAESLSASENQKWRIQNDYKQGILPMCHKHIYGYKRLPDGNFEIVPQEAEVIRYIFELYLEENGAAMIARILNDRGIPNCANEPWNESTIKYIISNEKYMGDLLLQKCFVINHLTKKKIQNKGQRNQVYVKNNHPPIISREIFEQVQIERERRKEKQYKEKTALKFDFTSKITCGQCGKNYRRRVTKKRVCWACTTYMRFGKSHCPSNQIPEETLYHLSNEVLGISHFNKDIFEREIQSILVGENNTITFNFKNGKSITKQWKFPSRADSWTPEMKQKAGERTKLCHKKK